MQMSVSIHKLIGDAINPARDNYIHDLIATPPTHFMEMDAARLIDGARSRRLAHFHLESGRI
jgi:hypothetical protein